jgi:hypothetical protein
MAQPKFGTRRRAMLSFERQPFPAPCHVDQDVAHSRAWCALGHLTTFDRVLSALYRRNHLPTPPCTRPNCHGSLCGQQRFRPRGYTSVAIVTFAQHYNVRASGPRSSPRPGRGGLAASRGTSQIFASTPDAVTAPNATEIIRAPSPASRNVSPGWLQGPSWCALAS